MPIRILHVIPALGRGGAERQLATLVCNTAPGQFEHVVCCLGSSDGGFADEIIAAGHRVIGLSIKGDHDWLRATRKLVPLIRAERPQVIQTWLFDATVSVRLAQLFSQRVATITTLQDLIYEPETVRVMNWSPRKVAVRRWIDRITASWSSPMFVAPSQAWELAARQQLGIAASEIRTIYNSVDPGAFTASPGDRARLRVSLGIPTDAVVFLNMGRLDPQKGQSFLLRAFGQVLREAPDTYLVILGGGRLESQLRLLAETTGVTENVRFAGVTADVAAFFAMADVFVFPSVFEGLGLALVEAMAHGLPCIASRIPALCEVISDDAMGVLVTPAVVEDLATAMLTLSSDASLRTSISRAGSASALSRFHVRATIPSWEHLYLEVTARLN